MIKGILTFIFVLDCIFISAVILLQESKQAGLGAIGGMAESYWGKNKGRSMEGRLLKITRILVILFIVISAVLNMGFMN